ncbi:MAG: hypothetical protein AAF571_08655 [Verrucomicrobiota bacterium]
MTHTASEEPQVIHHHHYINSSTPDTAMLLELLPGFFFQTFGIGHIYTGNVATGLLIMFSYWILCIINLLLCFVLIGFLTGTLTCLAFMIFSSIAARNAAERKLEQESARI